MIIKGFLIFLILIKWWIEIYLCIKRWLGWMDKNDKIWLKIILRRKIKINLIKISSKNRQ